MTGHLDHGDNVWIGGTEHDGPECPNRLDVAPLNASEPEYICGCRPWELTGEHIDAVVASSSDAPEPASTVFGRPAIIVKPGDSLVVFLDREIDAEEAAQIQGEFRTWMDARGLYDVDALFVSSASYVSKFEGVVASTWDRLQQQQQQQQQRPQAETESLNQDGDIVPGMTNAHGAARNPRNRIIGWLMAVAVSSIIWAAIIVLIWVIVR